jgi:predicted ATPase/DNA-binding SARP family transcriptional activator
VPQILHFHLLGDFRIVYGDQLLTSVNSPRLLALLVYLLLHREVPQPRRYLSFLLWPDSSEAQARTNLRNLLYSLRQALPDADRFLTADTHTLHWRPNVPFTADFINFEKAVTGANSSLSLKEAVDLYQGDLFPNCYDDWIQPERERLRKIFVEGIKRLIDFLEKEQDYLTAIRYAERLLHQDPLQEETYRHLMRLYALSGDRTGMMGVYRTCANVLKRELDTEVSATTRSTYEQLVQLEVSPVPQLDLPRQARSNNLPLPLTSFIGREDQIAELRQLLLKRSAGRPHTRLLTLTGVGGCGKTRLAIEVARSISDLFKHGAWLVELASLADPLLVPQQVAAVFGLREQQERKLGETLADYLEAKEILLVLDNCEHLLGTCAQLVESLLQVCPELQIVATSRERLNIPGESVWQVPPLSLPHSELLTSITELHHSDAVRLFVERAAAILPTFELTRRNAAVVTQICSHLDGIPLAIELAAARVRVLSVEQIATRLNNRFRLLRGGSRTALPHHQTLWDLIDWSYELLPESERVLLGRLVVFAGSWTLEAAEAICAGEGIETTQVLDLLIHLVDMSLITYETSGAGTRYRMYESIREYGRERLYRAEEEQRLCQLHLDYFLRFVESIEPGLRGPKQLQVLGLLEAELDNLRAALEWSLRNDDPQQEIGLGLAVAMTWFWNMKGYLYEGYRWLEKALQNQMNDGSKPSARRAKVLCDIGTLAIFYGDYLAAYPWLEQGISMWQSLGDECNLAYARTYWAHLLWSKGDRALAHMLWETDATVLRKRDDKWGLGWLIAWQARAARDASDFEAARPLYVESARLLREVGDEWAYAIVISHLGVIESAQGNYGTARALLEARLAIGQKMKSNMYISITQLWLGQVAQREGDVKRAAGHFKEGLRLSRQFDSGARTGCFLEGLASVLATRGEWKRAVRLFVVAERLLLRYNDAESQEKPSIKCYLDSASVNLDEATFASAWAEGQAMTLEQAIDLALATDS